METKRIHNLTKQGGSVQRTCLMHNDNSFSQSASSELHTEEVFDKFSPSKAMLVEDCSKRALSIDREKAVPLKKRKQLHQDSGLCDAFTDQNLQKSEPNEEDMAFCPKLEKENLCTSTPSTSEKGLEDSKIEFYLLPSINVKTDEYTEWCNLKCFESIIDDGFSRATFFAGGPIQSSAFCVTPRDTIVNQYIVVAVGNAIYDNHSCSNTQNVSGTFQFWNVGSLYEKKTINQSPSMELALCHDNGIITQMKWCPADCYDKGPSTGHLPRLGLLAASSSSSCVYIYSVPQPDFMKKLKHTLPIYFIRQLITLIPLFGGPSNTTTKAVATCIDWEKSGERIAAGYANGAVCVWRIDVSSFASNIAVKTAGQSYIIQPYLFFQASGACIASLSFAPFDNYRWFVVSSIDKLRFFDLHDTSAPLHVSKLGWENSCIWSDAFCGVYSSPALSSNGLISLSTKDCCTEGVQKGYFDSSACVAASEKGNCHAIADMDGVVTVNFLKKIDRPPETFYQTRVVFETKIVALDVTDMEREASKQKISISGNIPNHDLTSDAKDTSCTKIKQESSSSSSGFGSPNHDKTIVIEMTQCFDGESVNFLKSPAGSSLTESQDINNNGIKPFSNKPLNSGDEADDDMIKCSESSECFMRDLLMKKISNQSKYSSDILQLNASNNSANTDSKGAKYVSDKALITSSAAIDCTDDRIMYRVEPCFCDTSHPNPLMPMESSAQSNSFGAMHKKNENSTESSSKSWHETSTKNCSLNYQSRNLRKTNNGNLFHSNDITPTHSDIPGEECQGSKKFPKKIRKSKNAPFHNLDSKDSVVFKKDNIKLPSHESFDNPLCDVRKSNNLNQLKSLPDIPSSITNNNDICDKDDQEVSDRASIQSNAIDVDSEATIMYVSSAASDNSTITYWNGSYDCDKVDINNLFEKLGDTFQSLHKGEKENTFQKVKEVVNGAKTKLLTEKSSFAGEKYEHFLTKESVRKSSDYGTDSTAGSCNLGDQDKSFFPKDFFISDNFQLLDSKYLSEKYKEKHSDLNESPATPESVSQCSSDLDIEAPRNLPNKGIEPVPESYKNSCDLSYENLIKSFGVTFKNNLDAFTNPLNRQENDIYIKYNSLSVIKTMSWNPNEGCQSWLFVGGNSGICRLIYVPDFEARTEKKAQSIPNKRQQPKRYTSA